MITKLKRPRGPKRDYGNDSFDYIGDDVMITPRQKSNLISLYSQNIQDIDELNNRISELDELTSIEAEEIALQFLTATWS